MSPKISDQRLRQATTKVVRRAARPGGLLEREEFTMAVARRLIAEEMGVEEIVLKEGEMKGRVKVLVQEALDQIGQEEQASEAGPSSSSSPPISKAKRARKRRESSDEGSGFDDAKDDDAVSTDAASDVQVSSPPSGVKRTAEAKSKARGSKEASSLSPVAKSARSDAKSSPAPEDEPEEVKGHDVLASESEMSSVYDVPPSRSRKKKGSSEETKPRKRKSKANATSGSDSEPEIKAKTTRKKKDPTEGLSGDEARVVTLKKIVTACGVRKQWTKEFADCPTASKQVKRLQSILADLGMRGQPTIGKAKALKERRELAAELDDVREFEATRGLSAGDTRPSRSKGSAAKKNVIHSDTSDNDDDDDEPKEKSALDAVMDFFGGDDDSE